MKLFGTAMLVTALSLVMGCCIEPTEPSSEVPVLTGPYIGQEVPGALPEIFAPGYLPDIGYEHTATMFTADGTEAFWGRVINPQQSPRVHVIMHAKQVDGVWQEPELAPFNVGINSFIDSVSPDGKRVYFQAFQPMGNEGESNQRWTNWYAEKVGDQWLEPRLLEDEFKWEDKFFDYQIVNSGNRYFTSTMEGAGRNIGLFRSRLIDGLYEDPRPLGPSINSAHLDYAFYVDHDERFILFTSDRPSGIDGTGLFISVREPNDSWGPAISLAAVNQHFGGGVSWPYLSPDGKILFFVASVEAFENSDVEDGTYAQLKAIAQSPENGYLRVYWVDASFIAELTSATPGRRDAPGSQNDDHAIR